MGVARKKTKPGLDGAGGRYEPTTTSRAWAGSGARDTDSSAPSAAPSTSSLRWLPTATRGAGRDGTAFSADGAAACGGAAQQRELVGAGGRSEAKSGEDTEESMGDTKTGLLAARRRVWFARRDALSRSDERARYFLALFCSCDCLRVRGVACVRAARQRPLLLSAACG